MRTVTKLTDRKWMNLFLVVDPSKGVKGFEYAERLGEDSIAFIGYDKNKRKFLLTHEYLPPVDAFLSRAFGGSLDKRGKLKRDIVVAEAKEEGGYSITVDKVVFVGKAFVSSMMNQYCHLFIVDLTDVVQKEREPENAVEALAEPVWMTEQEVKGGNDWKAIAIIEKAKLHGIII